MGKYEHLLVDDFERGFFFLSGLIRVLWLCSKRTFKYTNTVFEPVNLLYTGVWASKSETVLYVK